MKPSHRRCAEGPAQPTGCLASGGIGLDTALDLTLKGFAALLTAVQRQQGRAQALQAQCLRLAAWGDADDFGRLLGRLNGVEQRADDGEFNAALAAFGLNAEM